MVHRINISNSDYYFFDDIVETFQDDYVNIEDCVFNIDSECLYFDDSLIRYIVQPLNKINKVKVDRQADLIFKKGDYTHTYITIDSDGIPNGINFKLFDENDNQLFSPFNPNGEYLDSDGKYIKHECSVKINEIDVIPLPADYITFKDWIDFEPGFYDWKLVSDSTDYYDSITIDLRVEIRDFEVWQPVINRIYPNGSVVYRLRNYLDIIPETTNLLTEHATYDKTTGEITYPFIDLNTSSGYHMQQVGNRFIEYDINQVNDYLINLALNGDGDIEFTLRPETEGLDDVIGSIKLSDDTINFNELSGIAINNLKINKDGDLTFEMIELGD